MPSAWATLKRHSERVWHEPINFCRAWAATATPRFYFQCMVAVRFRNASAGTRSNGQRPFISFTIKISRFRLCAVFGGVYCLKRSITEIYFANNDEKLAFDAIQCDAQRVQAKNIVFGHGSIASAKFESSPSNDETKSDAVKVCCGNLSRGIFITDTPIGDESLNSGGGGVIFLKMPSANGDGDGAFVIQLSHWSGCCPKGLCKSSFYAVQCQIHC